MAGYFASRMLAEPLRRADCCLVSDGAAAVVVCAADPAQGSSPSSGAHPRHGPGAQPRHLLEPGALRHPAGRALRPAALARAGLTAADVDVAMLYDCFTIVVLMQLEAYGFCARGESGDFVADGRIGPGGALAVNPSGGLLAEGYGGGMLHVIEAVRQLRGAAGTRQIEDAEVALVTGHGLGMNSHATLILGR